MRIAGEKTLDDPTARVPDEPFSDDGPMLSIDAFCEEEDIGKTTFYQEVNAGRLEAVKIGKSTKVRLAARRKWRANLPKYMPAF